MEIASADYFLIRACQKLQPLLRGLGDWEASYLSDRLASLEITRPVFITGLARAGSTLLLERFSIGPGVATHRYRDFPCLMIPYLWNRYLDLFPVKQQPVERAHRDRIRITRESPEAMEEPLWMSFFPHLHDPRATHRLTASDSHAEFERYYPAHVRKILSIRSGSRYVAKGNYHIPRIEYLTKIFPDSQFIVPIRHPLTHVHSLVRQHQLFSRYAEADSRIPPYLRAMGHFEFGPQRVPIRIEPRAGDRILEAFAAGDDYLGYSIQWAEVYRFVRTVLQCNSRLARQIHVVRYEDLCANPAGTLQHLFAAVEIELVQAGEALQGEDSITKSTHIPELDPSALSAIGAEVAEVAEMYGYDWQRF